MQPAITRPQFSGIESAHIAIWRRRDEQVTEGDMQSTNDGTKTFWDDLIDELRLIDITRLDLDAKPDREAARGLVTLVSSPALAAATGHAESDID